MMVTATSREGRVGGDIGERTRVPSEQTDEEDRKARERYSF